MSHERDHDHLRGFLLLGGRLADVLGRRRTLLFALALLTAVSLAGGFAPDRTSLVTARAVQGLGGAVLSPVTLTLLTTTFPEGPRRTRAMGVWSGVAGTGAAAGSVLGGVLTGPLGWRWILFVNGPIGAGALVAALAILGKDASRKSERRPGPDVTGAILVTAGLVTIVYGLLVGGALLSAAGLAWLSRLTGDGTFWRTLFVPGMLVTLGVGPAMTPLALAATSGVPREDAGLDSGVLNSTRQIGACIGLAVLSTVAATCAVTPHVAAPSRAFTSGYALAFGVAAAFALVAAVTSLAVPALSHSGEPSGRRHHQGE
ncbi:MFS transporter [Actinomadura nitritigenes]|uniref:MFS transporter n=1 Tax=Actinomadura nitritigenes TaxID=134602 RepID=UPI0036AC4FCC